MDVCYPQYRNVPGFTYPPRPPNVCYQQNLPRPLFRPQFQPSYPPHLGHFPYQQHPMGMMGQQSASTPYQQMSWGRKPEGGNVNCMPSMCIPNQVHYDSRLKTLETYVQNITPNNSQNKTVTDYALRNGSVPEMNASILQPPDNIPMNIKWESKIDDNPKQQYYYIDSNGSVCLGESKSLVVDSGGFNTQQDIPLKENTAQRVNSGNSTALEIPITSDVADVTQNGTQSENLETGDPLTSYDQSNIPESVLNFSSSCNSDFVVSSEVVLDSTGNVIVDQDTNSFINWHTPLIIDNTTTESSDQIDRIIVENLKKNKEKENIEIAFAENNIGSPLFYETDQETTDELTENLLLDVTYEDIAEKINSTFLGTEALANCVVPTGPSSEVNIGRQSEIIRAAKSLYSKRTRTLWHWINPRVPKARLKASVQSAWDNLPEWQKQIYISQVLGKFGVDAVSPMVNPQLTGINEISESKSNGKANVESRDVELECEVPKKRKYTKRNSGEKKCKRNKYVESDEENTDQQILNPDKDNSNLTVEDLDIANVDVSEEYWKQQEFEEELFSDLNF